VTLAGGGERGTSARVPLRHYRLFSRASSLEVGDGTLVLRLPGVFGANRPWRVPLADVAVVDQRHITEVDDDLHRGRVFVDPVTMPYLATTTASFAPNLQLLFREPVRMPAVRLIGALNLMLPFRASRSARGAWVDGIGVRARDPRSAIESLAASGVERIISPVLWLTDHRPTSTDPSLVETVQAQERRTRRVRAAVAAMFPVFVVTSWWARSSPSPWGLAAIGVECAAVFALPAWAKRRSRA
jgi:hypothetical protein